MSFGWSAGDIVVAINLALKVYNNYRSSCGELHDLTQDIDGFKNVLQQVHKALKPIRLDIQQQKGLGVLYKQAVELLNDLDRFLQKNVHPDTGKLTPSKRLLWRTSNAEKLRKRMNHLTAYSSTYQNTIMSVAIHENSCAILETLNKSDNLSKAQNDTLSKEAPGLLDLRTPLTVPFDTGWPTSVAERTEIEYEATTNNDFQNDITNMLHGTTLVDPTSVQRVPTGSSGTTSSTAGRKSFLDTRPKAPPLAMHLRKRRTESCSSASLESKDKDPPPQPRATKSPLKNFKPKVPGSSAPSMSQQRLPFGPGFTSPPSLPRAITNTEIATSSEMMLAHSRTAVSST